MASILRFHKRLFAMDALLFVSTRHTLFAHSTILRPPPRHTVSSSISQHAWASVAVFSSPSAGFARCFRDEGPIWVREGCSKIESTSLPPPFYHPLLLQMSGCVSICIMYRISVFVVVVAGWSTVFAQALG
uniref:Uncharacterized protein n=1 Tax=Caenorhabditis japonica TaxID=281687 RepID=A0A8R1EHY3_CAEJA